MDFTDIALKAINTTDDEIIHSNSNCYDVNEMDIDIDVLKYIYKWGKPALLQKGNLLVGAIISKDDYKLLQAFKTERRKESLDR